MDFQSSLWNVKLFKYTESKLILIMYMYKFMYTSCTVLVHEISPMTGVKINTSLLVRG